MNPQKLKRSSNDDVRRDRLSELPDEIAVHILSFLPTVDAVRTMLFRRFRNLWTLVPSLTFDIKEVLYEMFPDGHCKSSDVKRFYLFVCNVVRLHKRPIIDEFHLCLDDDFVNYDKDGSIEMNKSVGLALAFALDNQTKEIKFCDVTYQLTYGSDFPNLISESLVTLELCHCDIDCQFEVNLGSLKKLSLRYVSMSEEAFQQLLSGCPSLQKLRIQSPRGMMKKLGFSAPNIRKLSLEICGEDKRDDDDFRLFDFPNIESLDLEIGWILDIVDVSSVRNVYLKGLWYDMNDENERKMFKPFLAKFFGAEVFQISASQSETFLHSIDGLHLVQSNWKRLVLELNVLCQSCLAGFYQLITSSTQVEELVIYITSHITGRSVRHTPSSFPHPSLKDSTDLPPAELAYLCVMPKLKTVTLHGYVKPWEHQLELIDFLLKSATALDKLVIVPNKSELTAMEKRDFVDRVLSFPKSSASARVLFQ